MMNRTMMSFPAVKAMDVLIGKACLEVISIVITLFLIISILWVADQNPCHLILSAQWKLMLQLYS